MAVPRPLQISLGHYLFALCGPWIAHRATAVMDLVCEK